MKQVMIISDATGETAERMVRAATLQFSEPVQVRLFSRVRLETELEQILEKASELNAHVEDAAVDVPRAARAQGRERAARPRRRSSRGAVAGRRQEGVRPDRPARH